MKKKTNVKWEIIESVDYAFISDEDNKLVLNFYLTEITTGKDKGEGEIRIELFTQESWNKYIKELDKLQKSKNNPRGLKELEDKYYRSFSWGIHEKEFSRWKKIFKLKPRRRRIIDEF